MLQAAHDGDVRAMYLMGENPAMSDPDTNHVRECLEALEFMVVQDIFLNETSEFADVVLPAAAFAEKDGTFTNTERRVQLIRPAFDPPGQARPDWQILRDIAQHLDGTDWDYTHPSEIMDEIAQLTPIYGGISYDRLSHNGLQWPCPNPNHDGTPILHKESFSRGRGYFSPVHHQQSIELPDKDYPLMLTTGRILQHWHTGTMTRRVDGLNALAPEELVEMHPQDAEQLGIQDGDCIRISSRRGAVKARVQVIDRPQKGLIFMTFHFAEALSNVLTINAVDPIAKIPEFKVCAVKVEKIDMPNDK
jgi:predicted molibdopterin-dependent oxidoreductase YjgC